MIYFLRLIRPINLLIIAMTMYAVRFFYIDLADFKLDTVYSGLHEQIDFFILALSTVMIAAGGNIINDYFDVKADRINRPERLIISKHIKQRWAIVSHWSLNGLAFSMAAYLSIRYHTFWYVFVHLISINALWFYSMYFKKKPVIGNVIVALLTALVPILSGIHFHTVGHLETANVIDYAKHSDVSFPAWILFLAREGKFIYGMAFFAFFLNVAREIIKDMQDIKGDEMIHAQTLPRVIGVKRSSHVAALILLVLPGTALMLYFLHVRFIFEDVLFFVPFLSSIVLSTFVALTLLIKHGRRSLKFYDNALKIAMLLGLILPFYWIFLL